MRRVPDSPEAFHHDRLRVAAEEAHHAPLVAGHLATLGHAYGDFDAHDGLWAMCEKTAGDPTARMALVPRTLEARGPDATPPMQAQLRKTGDETAAANLDVIERDEIGHVPMGNHWYRWLCERDGLDPLAHLRGAGGRPPGTHLASALQPCGTPRRGVQRGRDRRAGLVTDFTGLHFPSVPAHRGHNQASAP